MAVCDFRYNSYFSLSIAEDIETGTSAAVNVFDEDGYPDDDLTYTLVSSSDITYTPSDGKITFSTKGTYLVVFNLCIESQSGTVTAVCGIRVNGSYVFQTEGVYVNANLDPKTNTFHTVLDISEGDELEIVIDDETSNELKVMTGTSVVILKSKGDYGSLKYTVDSSHSLTGLKTLFHQDLGGTTEEKLRNVTFSAAASGSLTPAHTRKYLMISTLLMTPAATSKLMEHHLYADGSSLVQMDTTIYSGFYSPQEQTLSILKELTGAETASGRFKEASGSQRWYPQEGTSFSIFDVTNNGIDPSAYLSISTGVDSSENTSGDIDIFDAGEYSGGNLNLTVHVGAVAGTNGITFTQADGKFTVSNGGVYFVTLNVGMALAGTPQDGERILKIFKNDSSFSGTAIYAVKHYQRTTEDPQEVSACVLVDLVAGDYLNFALNKPKCKFGSGTSVTMFKVNDIPVNGDPYVLRSDERYGQINSESTPTAQISDDFTLNNYAIDNLSAQHKTIPKQVPFILGTPGPLSLRGRCTAITETPPNVSTGDKKN